MTSAGAAGVTDVGSAMTPVCLRRRKSPTSAVELVGVLDLRPVPAAPEDVQLRVVDQLEQPVGVVERDDPVVAAVHDQGAVRQGGDDVLRGGEGVDPALPGRGEHRRERLLEARAHRRGVAQLGELVGGVGGVEGEDVEQAAHRRQRRLVAPHPVEPVGDGERHPAGTHQHQALDPLGRVRGHRDRQPAAEAVADDREPVEPQRVGEAEQVGPPRVERVVEPLGPVGEAEADDVRRDDGEVLGQGRHRQPPVREGRDPRARAVHEQHDRAGAGAVVVRRDAVDVDGQADLGVVAHGRTVCRWAGPAPLVVPLPATPGPAARVCLDDRMGRVTTRVRRTRLDVDTGEPGRPHRHRRGRGAARDPGRRRAA